MNMSNLTVEKVIESDCDVVYRLASLAHGESFFSDIPFSREKFYRAFDNTITEPDTYLGLKISVEGRIVGFCYALLGGFYIGEEAKIVTVITIAVDPIVRTSMLGGKAALKLTRAVELWGKAMNASHVLYHATSGTNPSMSDRFFRKLGMTTLGGNYAKSITSS